MKRGSRILSLLLAGAIFLGSFDMSALAMEYGKTPVTGQELLRPEVQENFYEEENSEVSKEEQQLSEEGKAEVSEEEQQPSEEGKTGALEEEQQLSEEGKSEVSEEEQQPSKEGKSELPEEEQQNSEEEKLQLTEEEEQQSLKEMTHPVAEEMKQPSKTTKEVALQGNQTKVEQVAEYDDLMEVQVVYADPSKIQQKVYAVEELLEEEETVMPGLQLLSESYGNYWDMYSNHYFYNQFNQAEKDVWDAMEALFSGYLESTIDFPDEITDYIVVDGNEISKDRLYELAVMFKYTHPQYYFLYNMLSMYSQGEEEAVAFYVYSAFADGEERAAVTNQIKNQLDSWVNQVNEKDTEEEKVKLIHDLICEKVSYNYDAFNVGIMEVEQTQFTQSAYSVFCMDLTVCCGYTLAFTWVCNAVGIEAIGVSAPGHAYNMVKVCGDWYNLDITWNDVADGFIQYEYYLKNVVNFTGSEESTIGGSHSVDPEYEGLIPQRTKDSGSTYGSVGRVTPSQQKVATPVIQVTRGERYSTVRITSTTPGAAIYYTLDGKEPSESKSKGYLYQTEFQINKDAEIKAIAVADQYQDSDVAEAVVSYIYYEEARGSWGSNVTWILGGNGVLTLEGSGKLADVADASQHPVAAYKDKVKSVSLDSRITSIGNRAFSEFTALSEFTIPNGITSLGDEAFYKSGLKEITIPQTVTTVGNKTFSECPDLTKAVINGNISNMGQRMFGECDGLKQVILSDNLQVLGSLMFFGCRELQEITLPKNLRVIDMQALSFCFKLKELIIPASVTSIANYALYGSSGLVRLEIKADITKIPQQMADGCSSLQEVILPDTITTIGEGAFAGCTALESIRLPRGITSIAAGAFVNTTTIIGYSDSYAKTYADTYGNPFIDLLEGIVRVEFVTNTSEVIAPKEVIKNSLISEPRLQAKTGYTLKGWYTSATESTEDKKWNFSEDLAEANLTLYAHWQPKTYQLSFELNDRTLTPLSAQTITFDSPYGNLPNPVRAGYQFLGWYSSQQLTNRVTEATLHQTDSNVTLYAKWEAASYQVTFNANGGTVSQQSKNVVYGQTYGTLPTPTREGCSFEGWYTAKEGGIRIQSSTTVSITTAQTLYAKWKLNKPTFPQEGTMIAKGDKVTITAPNEQATVYYTVDGTTPTEQSSRYTAPFVIAEDSTVKAIAVLNGVTTSDVAVKEFQVVDVEFLLEKTEVSLRRNTTTRLNVAVLPEGKTENDITWTSDNRNIVQVNKGTLTPVAVGETIVRASTTDFAGNRIEVQCKVTVLPALYRVVFKDSNGSILKEEQVEEGTAATAPVLQGRTGYTFKGWSTDFLNVTTDMEVTARYEIITYPLTYLWNQETVATNNPSGYTIETGTINLTDPILAEGYEFKGWYTNQNFTGEKVTSIAAGSYGAKTLYANISYKQYKISYQLNGGTNHSSNPTTYNVSSSMVLQPASGKTGFIFAGWYNNSSFIGEPIEKIERGTTGNLTLYAKWEAASYQVTFNANGGTVSQQSKNVVYGQTYGTLPTPAREGCSFEGWYTAKEGGVRIQSSTTVSITTAQTLYAKWKLNKPTFPQEASAITRGGKVAITAPNSQAVVYYTVDGTTPTEQSSRYTAPFVITEDTTVKAIAVLNGVITSDVAVKEFRVVELEFLLEKTEVSLRRNTTTKLNVAVLSEGKTENDITWTSDNRNIVEVNKGTLTPVAVGETIVRASITDDGGNKIEVQCKVTVLPALYRVVFKDSNGALLKEEQVEEGTSATAPALQERTGYTFNGWSADFSRVITDMEVTPRYEIITYPLTYLWNQEPIATENPSGYTIETGTINLTAPVLTEGYEFKGWYTNQNFTGEKVTTIAAGSYGAKTLYANIGYKQYSIAYELEGGTNHSSNPSTYNISSSVVLQPASGKDGFIFIGWYDNSSFTGEPIEKIQRGITGNLTLYAKWKDERGLWMEEIEPLAYTGKKVQPAEIKVYDGSKLLEKGKDYTVSYKNNINANDLSEDMLTKAPAVVIKGKGNYQGTITKNYEITRKSLQDQDVIIDDITLICKNNKKQLPVPAVTWNGKKLVNNKDFKITYVNSEAEGAFTQPGTYTIMIEGMKNYTGVREITLKLISNEQILLSKVKISKIPDQVYSGTAVAVEELLKLTYNNQQLQPGTDYTLDYGPCVEAGTYTVVITGQGKYQGTVRTTFKITGIPMSKVKIDGIPTSIMYNGTPLSEWDERLRGPIKLTYTYKEGSEARTITLTPDDYQITFDKTDKRGTGQAIITGKNRYTGTVKKSIKVTPQRIESEDIWVFMEEPVIFYEKNGAKPLVTVVYNDTELVQNRDYKLTYKNNKSVNLIGDGKADAVVVINGIGNFTGKKEVLFEIQPADISTVSIMAQDVEAGAAGKYISKPKLTDKNGKVLISGKDYESTVEYLNEEGDILGKKDVVEAGREITVIVRGKGNYEGEIFTTYRILQKSMSISKATIKLQSGKKWYYTGEQITLQKEDLIVKIGKTRLKPEEYEIIRYSNNVNKGTAKVTIQGTGAYGGTKEVSFKINSQTMKWWQKLLQR